MVRPHWRIFSKANYETMASVPKYVVDLLLRPCAILVDVETIFRRHQSNKRSVGY